MGNLDLLEVHTLSQVTVVSSIEGEAAALLQSLRRPNVAALTKSAHPSAGEDWEYISELIATCNGVLSLLPASMHPDIARLCVRHGTPMVTASYVCDRMASLDSEARAAGVPILCEMGLDPGMDHMSAVQVIARAKARGGTVTSFR